MKKNVRDRDVYYYIEWSRLFEYDRHSATRLMPELPGIVWLQHRLNKKMVNMLFFACWRDGCRVGLKKLLDEFNEFSTTRKSLRDSLMASELYLRYTVIDTSRDDIQDIMYWLINEYKPELNELAAFADSKRYMNIFIKEHFEEKT